jgi:hypothetical protein
VGKAFRWQGWPGQFWCDKSEDDDDIFMPSSKGKRTASPTGKSGAPSKDKSGAASKDENGTSSKGKRAATSKDNDGDFM